MFASYLKAAFRNLKKYKGYSFINIFGLAVGIACCILILMWVRDELSFDGFHAKAARLFRIVEQQTYQGGEIFPVAVTPAPLAPSIKEEFPEIAETCRFTTAPRFLVRYEDRRFYERRLGMADPSFFTMFSFPLIKGDPNNAFPQLNSIVISQSTAEKYFGDENPIGKVFRMENMFDLVVSGVMRDIPKNSHLQFDFVMPFKLLEFGGQRLDQWGNNAYFTYAELTESAISSAADEKIRNYLQKHLPESNTTLHLQPLQRIHLHSDYVADVPGHGDIRYVSSFALVALCVLLIAYINFVNLATARSGNRAREVGMRKVTGARRGDILWQFLGESVLFALIALILAVGIVALLLPAFNNLSAKSMTLAVGQSWGFLVGLVGMAVLAGMGAGIYPALFLSGFDPARVLRASAQTGPKGRTFRRILVVVQFALSIGLIISSVVVRGQLEFIRNKDLGFDREQVVYMNFGVQTANLYEAFKTEALTDPAVQGVTCAGQLPTYILNSTSDVTWPGKDPNEELLFHNTTVTYDYFSTMKMEIVEGRAFSKEYPTDEKQAYIINQAAARVMGPDSPLGKSITWWENTGTVIGIVKDFHFKSINTRIEPLLIRLRPAQPYSYLFIRVDRTGLPETLERLTRFWEGVSPAFPLDLSFLDESFDRLYRAEQRMGTLFGAFTVLAILIACLGLLGLASFMAEKRTREIGIRKVLGATISGIIMLLSREFVILVAVANLLAWPAAGYAMSRWLQNYAYHQPLNPLVFLGAALAALLIALLTVSFQALRAASADPVDSLRYE
jgi:putative ABC transport system permease protein